jgi:signal transduction histidine kinase/CheY-like chemotaxis protein
MHRSFFCYILILLFALTGINGFASDTLFVKEAKDNLEIYKFISILEDPQNKLDVDSIIKIRDPKSFYANKDPKLNFEYSRSTFWLRLVVKNDTKESLNYILEISNPDLDYVNFYEVQHGILLRANHTGELTDLRFREIYHRNFLFPVSIKPGENYTYYLSVNNNGHSCTIPLELKSKTYFERYDHKTEIFNWLVYGLLIFIMIFNFYMYLALKDKVNLYYFLSLIFAILFLLQYEGYYYFINPSKIIEKFKYINPCLYLVFLLSFTQTFINYYKKFVRLLKFLNLLKGIALIAPFFYIMKYPLSFIADIGVPLILLTGFVIIIFLAIVSYKKDYLPSRIFLASYSIVFLGLLIHQLKEFDLINPNFFVINAIKIGLTIQNILLTIAVLERFRINQIIDKQTISDNLLKIALQNKELEIINTELEKLSIVASETDNSIAIYDSNGRMEWGNTGFEKLYEVNINDLMKNARDNIELIVPNENIRHYVKKCMESKLPVVFETPVVTKSKKVLWVQTTLSPFIRSEKIFKIIAIDSDITSLKTYEKELETAKEKAVESDRLKTAFLSNMSHEIRTPLNGIMGFSQLLNGSGITPDELQNYLEIIRTCGEQLMHIIDDILEISLIESNQLKIFPVEFELKSFIREIVEFFETYKTTIGKTHIELVNEIEIEESQYVITSDPFRLKQVLINLLKNGFKFTKEGQIKIGIYPKAHFLYFYVQDTGISIDPEKKDIIFERFRQGEETMSRKYGGSGLGLSISKGIIEKLGGNIWLDTTYKNGFKIYFTIPLVVSHSEVVSPKNNRVLHPLEGKIKGKRILIVEDHDISFKYLKEILLPYGPKLTWAVNGREAVDLVMKNQYDLILMDINLPEMDGFAATREIRKVMPDLPIIVQTAHAIESELVRIRTSGCNDLISKPINKKEFFEKLLRHL